jgi:hypothetical protein
MRSAPHSIRIGCSGSTCATDVHCRALWGAFLKMLNIRSEEAVVAVEEQKSRILFSTFELWADS